MATAGVRQRMRDRPLVVALVLSALGYTLVTATFTGVIPYPYIGKSGVTLLSHAIALVNSIATILLASGWYWIRQGEVRKHRTAMLISFVLIMLFLLMYLPKVGGGGVKRFVLDTQYAWVPLWGWIEPAYLIMLAIHIVLSVLAVPLVLYAVVLGLSHTPSQLTETRHATVGRIAAATWILSLTLGVITYVMLNHLYAAEFVPA